MAPDSTLELIHGKAQFTLETEFLLCMLRKVYSFWGLGFTLYMYIVCILSMQISVEGGHSSPCMPLKFASLLEQYTAEGTNQYLGSACVDHTHGHIHRQLPQPTGGRGPAQPCTLFWSVPLRHCGSTPTVNLMIMPITDTNLVFGFFLRN